MLTSPCDVLVMGGGPCGAVAAYVLARAGARVVLLRQASRAQMLAIGETLSPDAQPLLARLGLGDCLRSHDHLQSAGHLARWGSDILQSREAILNCYGTGWHLDRRRFDETLVEIAATAGTAIISVAGPVACDHRQRRWEACYSDANQPRTIRATFLLDCTGRSAHYAIRNGAKRQVYDKLIAAWALLETQVGIDADTQTYIEAVPEGWIYSARIPGGRRAVAFFTDGDLLDRRLLRSDKAFLRCLLGSPHVASLLKGGQYRIIGSPACVSATSARLSLAHGLGWLAAGDAAQTFDPLSSQGIVSAIVSGNNAATCLIEANAGHTAAIAAYQESLNDSYKNYMRQRHYYYGIERRWPDHLFWQRRHVTVAA